MWSECLVSVRMDVKVCWWASQKTVDVLTNVKSLLEGSTGTTEDGALLLNRFENTNFSGKKIGYQVEKCIVVLWRGNKLTLSWSQDVRWRERVAV